jgi:hypothetical protein
MLLGNQNISKQHPETVPKTYSNANIFILCKCWSDTSPTLGVMQLVGSKFAHLRVQEYSMFDHHANMRMKLLLDTEALKC